MQTARSGPPWCFISSWPSPSSPNKDTLAPLTRLLGTHPRETFTETTVPIRWLPNSSGSASDFTDISSYACFRRMEPTFTRFFTRFYSHQKTHPDSSVPSAEPGTHRKSHLTREGSVGREHSDPPAAFRAQCLPQRRVKISHIMGLSKSDAVRRVRENPAFTIRKIIQVSDRSGERLHRK